MYHLDESLLRSVRGLEKIRDYETKFPTVLPVRANEEIEYIRSMRKAEEEDLLAIITKRPFANYPFKTCVIQDSVCLVMSEVLPLIILSEKGKEIKGKLWLGDNSSKEDIESMFS